MSNIASDLTFLKEEQKETTQAHLQHLKEYIFSLTRANVRLRNSKYTGLRTSQQPVISIRRNPFQIACIAASVYR